MTSATFEVGGRAFRSAGPDLTAEHSIAMLQAMQYAGLDSYMAGEAPQSFADRIMQAHAGNAKPLFVLLATRVMPAEAMEADWTPQLCAEMAVHFATASTLEDQCTVASRAHSICMSAAIMFGARQAQSNRRPN